MRKPIDPWFLGFILTHAERVPRDDWPGADREEFWDVWMDALHEDGIDEELADAASRMVSKAPPKFLDQHLASLRAAARHIRDRLTADRAVAEQAERAAARKAEERKYLSAEERWESMPAEDRARVLAHLGRETPGADAMPPRMRDRCLRVMAIALIREGNPVDPATCPPAEAGVTELATESVRVVRPTLRVPARVNIGA